MNSLCFRMDDVHPKMDWERFSKFMDLMKEFGIYPLLGVIPDCRDDSICKTDMKNDFWDIIRDYQKQGCSISMHGYDHVYQTNKAGIFPVNNFSEFAGIGRKEQEEKISKGKEMLERNGIYTDIFMAPGHSFDDTTVEVLKKNGFHYVTDGFQKRPYVRNGMIFLPVTMNIRAVEKGGHSGGIITLVIHTNTMDDGLLERYRKICEYHKSRLLSYEDILSLEPHPYDRRYELRMIKKQRRMNKIYGTFKKVLKR